MAHNPSTELRIEAICAIMRARWFTADDRAKMAREFDLSDDRMRHLTAEASKRILAEVTDHDTIKLEGGVALRRIIREGADSADARDRSNAIKAIDVWSSVMGASAAKKIDATVTSVEDDGLARKLAGLVAGAEAGSDSSEPDGGGTPEG